MIVTVDVFENGTDERFQMMMMNHLMKCMMYIQMMFRLMICFMEKLNGVIGIDGDASEIFLPFSSASNQIVPIDLVCVLYLWFEPRCLLLHRSFPKQHSNLLWHFHRGYFRCDSFLGDSFLGVSFLPSGDFLLDDSFQNHLFSSQLLLAFVWFEPLSKKEMIKLKKRIKSKDFIKQIDLSQKYIDLRILTVEYYVFFHFIFNI